MSKTVWKSRFSNKWFWKIKLHTETVHGSYKTKKEAIKAREEYCKKFAPKWLEYSEQEEKFVPIKIRR